MQVSYKEEDLITFEEQVCEWWANKLIKAPIHLHDGCESQMIEIFRTYVEENDYLCCSWRSHYPSLLKGVPQEEMKKEILAGRSISLCFPEYRVISSGIVGGIIPIAAGIALGIKKAGKTNKVICFVGDMTSAGGVFSECERYCTNFDLPIIWVIEDNNKSVVTSTRDSWGGKLPYEGPRDGKIHKLKENILYYSYESKYPHSGTPLGRIQF